MTHQRKDTSSHIERLQKWLAEHSHLEQTPFYQIKQNDLTHYLELKGL